jgi:hypothetical protein
MDFFFQNDRLLARCSLCAETVVSSSLYLCTIVTGSELDRL